MPGSHKKKWYNEGGTVAEKYSALADRTQSLGVHNNPEYSKFASSWQKDPNLDFFGNANKIYDDWESHLASQQKPAQVVEPTPLSAPAPEVAPEAAQPAAVAPAPAPLTRARPDVTQSRTPVVQKPFEFGKDNAALAPMPSSAPLAGGAQNAIDQYLAGQGSPLSLNYTPGEVDQIMNQRIQYERDKQQLEDAGINPEGIIYQDQINRTDDGGDRELTPIELRRLQETGHAGQVLGENTIGGWGLWDDSLTAGQLGLTADERLSKDFSHLGGLSKVPGVGTALAGAAGGYNRSKQRELRAAGGKTLNIGGQPVTVGPQGQVVGTLPPGVNANHVRDFAVKQGILDKSAIDTRPSWAKKAWSSVTDLVGQKKEHDAAEAQRVAEERAAAQARLDIARRGGDPYANESDDDWNDRTQAASSRIDWSAPSDADLEDVYGGTTDWNFKKGGKVMYKKAGGPLSNWEEDPLARSMVQAAPLGQSRVATPAGMPQQGPSLKDKALQFGKKYAMNAALPGSSFMEEGLKSLFMNAGGDVSGLYKKGGEVSYGPLASVKYKKTGGEITEEVERKYHNTKANSFAPAGGKDGSK